MLRRRLAGDVELTGRIDSALDSVKRIAEIIANVGRLARLELHGSTANVPPMLDIRRSGSSEPG